MTSDAFTLQPNGGSVNSASLVWPVRLARPLAPALGSEPALPVGRPLWVRTGWLVRQEWFVQDRDDLPAAVLDVPGDAGPLDPARAPRTTDQAAEAWLAGWTTAVDAVTDLSAAWFPPRYRSTWDGPETTDLPPALLHRIALGDDPVLRRRVAGHPNTAPDTLQVLAGASEPGLRAAVAANPAAPAAVLADLAADPSARVRAAVAGSRACSPGLLERLAADPDPGVVGAVAGNPRTPTETLRRLKATTTDPRVRGALDRNPALGASTPRPVPGWVRDVLTTPVDRPATSSGATDQIDREYLAADELLRRAALVRSHPDLPPEVLAHALRDGIRHHDTALVLAVLDHPHAPWETILTGLARDGLLHGPRPAGETFQAALAQATTTPTEVLTQLAASPSVRVRAAVAANPACPPGAATALAGDDSGQVRRALAHRLPPGDPALDRLHVADLTPRRLALHLATRQRVTHHMLPGVLRQLDADHHDLVGAALAALT